MKIEKAKMSDLISPDYNPRNIAPLELEKLKNSIEEFGYIDPIIVNEVNNHIIGGNQRYEVLNEMGYREIDVIYIHEEDENREKALNIALNKISGEWDNSKLVSIFEEFELEGFDVQLTGFSDLEITELRLEEDLEFYVPSDDDLIEEYEEPTTTKFQCPKCGFVDETNKFKKIEE